MNPYITVLSPVLNFNFRYPCLIQHAIFYHLTKCLKTALRSERCFEGFGQMHVGTILALIIFDASWCNAVFRHMDQNPLKMGLEAPPKRCVLKDAFQSGLWEKAYKVHFVSNPNHKTLQCCILSASRNKMHLICIKQTHFTWVYGSKPM